MKIDVQTIFWVDAFLYLMLHVALWYGLARFRSRVAVMWSAAGILSALSLCVLGSRGLMATDLIVVWGQLLMGLGNWGRQVALRSIDGPADARWLWLSGRYVGDRPRTDFAFALKENGIKIPKLMAPESLGRL